MIKTRILLKIIKFIQKKLWLIGIAVHDPIFNECTPDFNCCCNIGRETIIKIPQYINSKLHRVNF